MALESYNRHKTNIKNRPVEMPIKVEKLKAKISLNFTRNWRIIQNFAQKRGG